MNGTGVRVCPTFKWSPVAVPMGMTYLPGVHINQIHLIIINVSIDGGKCVPFLFCSCFNAQTVYYCYNYRFNWTQHQINLTSEPTNMVKAHNQGQSPEQTQYLQVSNIRQARNLMLQVGYDAVQGHRHLPFGKRCYSGAISDQWTAFQNQAPPAFQITCCFFWSHKRLYTIYF